MQKEQRNQQGDRSQQVKKWKGKDWYTILAPKTFNENFLAEAPATDPKSLIGRVVPALVSDLTGDRSKNYLRLFFKINDVKDKRAFTSFLRLEALKEFISRSVRKGSGKIESFDEVKTKDDWVLQISTTTILNRDTDSKIKTKVRKHIGEYLQKNIAELTLDDFLKSIFSSVHQKKIRKEASFIYPVRFMEIHKIEVLKTGSS